MTTHTIPMTPTPTRDASTRDYIRRLTAPCRDTRVLAAAWHYVVTWNGRSCWNSASAVARLYR